jgi:hypothetical protein
MSVAVLVGLIVGLWLRLDGRNEKIAFLTSRSETPSDSIALLHQPSSWEHSRIRAMHVFRAFAATLVVCLLPLTPVAAQDRPASATQAPPVSFSHDVLPILQRNCQSCHRPGEIAPMSFLTYESTRPWAKAIKAAVAAKKMPPWFADPLHGRFSNDRSLKPADIDTLVKWVDGGAVMGDPDDAPPAVMWPDGWQITPDYVVTAPAYTIPAKGTIEWGYIVIPSGFSKDTWVTSIEIRPGDREAVHHVVALIKPHSPEIPYNVWFWDQKERDAKGVAAGQPFQSAPKVSSAGQSVSRAALNGEIGAVYVPGVPPQDYRVHRAAKLIPANSDLVLQVHYTTVGKAVTEITRIGFTVAKEEPLRRFLTFARQPPSIDDPKIFRIPAGDPNWASPPLELGFDVDAELVWMMPHMHNRGKDMNYRLTFPDGRSESVLNVPRYDFNWQIGYEVLTPVKVPKGTKLRVDAHFDNSAANRGNPDPSVDVYAGTQTWEEMMNPWFGIVVDRSVDPAAVITSIPVPKGG